MPVPAPARLTTSIARIAALVVLAACGGGDSPTGPGTTPPPGGNHGGGGGGGTSLAIVRVTPSTANVLAGNTTRLVAAATDASGRIVSGAAVSWESLATTVAQVGGDGTVTGLVAGQARVVARSGAFADTATITVEGIAGGSVTVEPATLALRLGTTGVLTAAVRDVSGTVVGQPVTWSTDSPSTVSVSNIGIVSGVAVGTARIIATRGTRADTSIVTVAQTSVSGVIARLTVTPIPVNVPRGRTVQLKAVAHDAQGGLVGGAYQVVWRSLHPSVASVSAGGTVSGIMEGTARVIALAGAAADTVTVTVGPPPVGSVLVSPRTMTLSVGSTTTLVAVARDALDNALAGRTLNWRSDAPDVVNVTASGRVTGVSAGVARIIVAAEGHADTAVVTVRAGTPPPDAATVTVTPSPVSLTVGGTQALTAVVRDGAGGTMGSAPVSWKSSDAAVATVSNSGAVTAVAAGSATITATSGGVSGTAAVTVAAVAPTPATVAVTPSPVSLTVGGTQTLGATVRDGSGTIMGGVAVSWTTSSAAVATVSAGGVVTAVAAGSATITARSGSVSGTVVLTVTAPEPTPASVTVSPTSVTMRVGVTEALRATVRDAGGTVIGGTVLTWTTSNAAVATVSSTGLVTAVGAGSATITVVTGSVSGTASIAVTVPVRETVVKQATDIGTIGEQDGLAAQLPGVLVAGDDDENNFAPLQAFITYSLADLPADARIESASLGLTMESAGVFGNPFGLGGLYVEWASTLSVNAAAPGISSVLVTGAFAETTATDVTALVAAARAAGVSSITFRLRFALPRDSNGVTDQLELAADALRITFAR